MRDFMVRLAGFLGRRRRWVLAAWIVVVAIALPIASHQTDHLTGGGFDVPGSESMSVRDSLESDFGDKAGQIAVLLQAEDGAGPAARAAAIARARRAVAELDEVSLPPATTRRAELALRRTGTAMLALHSEKSSDLQIDSATDLREALDPGTAVDGVTTYLAGQPTIWAGMQELSKDDLKKSEAGGFPLVAIILLGFFSVMVTVALIYFISLQVETSVFVTNMASMIGIGVAIDYSLFILARYRQERRAGRAPEEARSQALATSGLAVSFSGLAVIVSLAGLWMVQNQALRSMALGAMVVVAIAILVATTLLPALIRILGHRVEAGGIAWKTMGAGRAVWRKRRRRGSTRPDRETFWQR